MRTPDQQQNTSQRIEVLRFPLILGVVFIHNATTTVSMANGSLGAANSSPLVRFVIDFISQGAARLAVPLFFAISGYLFFQGAWSMRRYKDKLHRRVRTLLLPFLLWNAGTLLLYAVVQSLPATQSYVSYSVWPPVRSFTPFDYLNALIGINGFPILPPFWFLRDLMLLILLAPVVRYLLRGRLAPYFLAGLAIFWASNYWPVLWPSCEASFFFCIGSWLAIGKRDLTRLDSWGAGFSGATLALLVADASLGNSNLLIHKLMLLAGLPAVWWLAKKAVASPRLRAALHGLSGCSFFVFAAHQPLLLVLRKIAFRLLSPLTDIRILSLYFLIPIFLTFFLVAVYYALEWRAPQLTGFLTGRELRKIPA